MAFFANLICKKREIDGYAPWRWFLYCKWGGRKRNNPYETYKAITMFNVKCLK